MRRAEHRYKYWAEGRERQNEVGRKLQEHGIATALSIDHWSAPESSSCHCKTAPDLSVNFICMHPHPDSTTPSSTSRPPDKATAARFQEIFVDLAGMHCASLDASSRHVLDDRFDSFLGKGDREFKEALMGLMESGLTDDARNTPAFRVLDDTLRSKMGYRNAFHRKGFVRGRANSNHTRTIRSEERGAQMVSGLLATDATIQTTKGTSCDAIHPNIESLQRTLDAIQANPEICQRLGCLGRDASDERIHSLLRNCLSEEDLQVFILALSDPSLRVQSKVLRSLLRPPGHVFVCNTSVCDLHCDAFLCGGRIAQRKDCLTGTIHHQWIKNILNRNLMLKEHIAPYKFKRYDSYKRVVTHRNWPWAEFQHNQMAPVPFFVGGEVSLEQVPFFVGGEVSLEQSRPGQSRREQWRSLHAELPTKEQHVESLMETVRQFITVALLELRSNQPKPLAGRGRYLLAVPVLGTGGGYAGDLTGHVIESLLRLLSESVLREGDVDVVVVCADEATFAHAQAIRLSLMSQINQTQMNEASHVVTASMFPCFQWMTAELRDCARQLAELASSGHLALFLGAGVSIGSGLPGWFSLLGTIEDLFTPNGMPEERKLGKATKWDPLLMANLLTGICVSRPDRHGVKDSLKKRICEQLDANGRHPGLLLSLLLSLPCHSIVTQNYDQLIERAFECANVADSLSSKELSVIPYHPRRKAHHWLLKMHGCITAPEEIIITGDDYANFNSSRYKALGGLVQASLMTKHLLFVGFSLTDPNYLNIIAQVRDALHDSSNKIDATSTPNPLIRFRSG